MLVDIQLDVTIALALVARLMDGQSRNNRKYFRQEIFLKANDVSFI